MNIALAGALVSRAGINPWLAFQPTTVATFWITAANIPAHPNTLMMPTATLPKMLTKASSASLTTTLICPFPLPNPVAPVLSTAIELGE